MKQGNNIEEIERKLKVTFHNKELIYVAFTHSSYLNENKGDMCNERIEFLGDSVLGLIVAEYLHEKFPHLEEGELSDLRSLIVEAKTCSLFVKKLQLEGELRLGKGERGNSGKGRETILADLFEAIIGAIYLDGGLACARTFFLTHFEKEIEEIIAQPQKNWKAQLQEYVQKKFFEPPSYEVLEEWGPPHQKNFRVAVFVNKEKMGVGVGASKKVAQQQAAGIALSKLLGEYRGS